MPSIQPQLFVDRASSAAGFYGAAFGAVVVHEVGAGDDLVLQLAVGGALFWVTSADAALGRVAPSPAGGASSRMLLVVADPAAVHARAVRAGATELSPVEVEHGWLVGRVTDPFGHEWEIGRALSEPAAPRT